MLRLNNLSPIVLTKYVVRGMMADGRGRIVNLSSIIASTGYNALSVYGATKAAMIGFTKSLSREVGRLGITVNAIAPGFIDTEMTRGLDETQRKRIADRSALRRLAEVEDVANMAAYLIGDQRPQHHRRRHDGGCRRHSLSLFCERRRNAGRDNVRTYSVVSTPASKTEAPPSPTPAIARCSTPCVANSATARRSMPKATQPVWAGSPALLRMSQVRPKWSR